MLRYVFAGLGLFAGAFTGLALQPASALSCACSGETWLLTLESTSCETCGMPAEAELMKDDWSTTLDLGGDLYELVEE